VTRSIAARHRSGRLLAAAAGVAAAVLSLSACGAGQIAATATIVSAVPGGSATVGVPDLTDVNSQIQIENVLVEYPGVGGWAAGQSAPVSLRIANQTQSPITVKLGDATLIGPKAGAAAPGTPLGSLVWAGGGNGVTTPVTTPPSAAVTPTPSQSGAPSVPPTGSVPSSPPPATGSPLPIEPDLVIPPMTLAILAPSNTIQQRYLQISNMSQPVRPGDTVSMSFTFVVQPDNGPAATYQTTVVAPLAPPASAAPRVSVSFTGTPGA